MSIKNNGVYPMGTQIIDNSNGSFFVKPFKSGIFEMNSAAIVSDLSYKDVTFNLVKEP